jgi:predicted dehydrogenase
MTEPDIRVGLIGFGRHLRRYLLPNIAGEPRLLLRAVADPQPDLRAEARRRLPGVAVHAEGAALLAGGGLDAVIISTGPASHPALTGQALEHGLHVFVEKPLGTSAATVRQLAEQAQRRGLVAMNGTMWRWAPATTVLRRWLAGRQGTGLLAMTVTLPRIDLAPDWRDDWRLGLLETAFFDAFVHPVDWATQFLAPVVEVRTTVVETDEDRGRVVVVVHLHAEDGAVASLSMVTGSEAYQVSAWGSLRDGGLWELDTLQHITVTTQPTWSGTPGGMRDRATLEWRPGQLYRGWGRQGYAEEFTAFADAICSGRPGPAGNLGAVAHTFDVLDAGLRSARTGAAEPVTAGARL